MVNLKIEGDPQGRLIQTLLGLDMTIERVEYTDGGQLDALTKYVLHLRIEIPWLDNRQSRKEDHKGC